MAPLPIVKGMRVRREDGTVLGTVIEIREHEIVVSRGHLFPHDTAVPRADLLAIRGNDLIARGPEELTGDEYDRAVRRAEKTAPELRGTDEPERDKEIDDALRAAGLPWERESRPPETLDEEEDVEEEL
jgi:hypothetical protein